MNPSPSRRALNDLLRRIEQDEQQEAHDRQARVERGMQQMEQDPAGFASTDVNALAQDVIALGHADFLQAMVTALPELTISQLSQWLHKAIDLDANACTRCLLSLGANPEFRNPQGETALMAAARGGGETLATILEFGGDIEATKENGDTVLITAIDSGEEQGLLLLIQAGANLNKMDGFDWAPLHHAINRGHRQAFAWLLEYGADPLVLEKDGSTLVHTALAHGQID